MPADRRATVFLGLIFCSGLLLGGTLMNLAEHFWLHAHSQDLKTMLHLSPQQKAQFDSILASSASQIDPGMETLRRQTRAQLRSVLDEGQQREFDALVQRLPTAESAAVHCSQEGPPR